MLFSIHLNLSVPTVQALRHVAAGWSDSCANGLGQTGSTMTCRHFYINTALKILWVLGKVIGEVAVVSQQWEDLSCRENHPLYESTIDGPVVQTQVFVDAHRP